MQLKFTLGLLLLFFVTTKVKCKSPVAKAFESYKVVPDVLKKPPTLPIKIHFPSGSDVNLGNELAPHQVKDTPTVSWAANPKAYYTLVMLDPDVPSRAKPAYREWRHWLVVNIPGIKVRAGKTLVQYIGADPQAKTGKHRHVLLVYKQPKYISFSGETKIPNTSALNRGRFSIQKFARKYKLGDPIAGNLFTSQFDDYVTILDQQLRGFK